MYKIGGIQGFWDCGPRLEGARPGDHSRGRLAFPRQWGLPMPLTPRLLPHQNRVVSPENVCWCFVSQPSCFLNVFATCLHLAQTCIEFNNTEARYPFVKFGWSLSKGSRAVGGYRKAIAFSHAYHMWCDLISSLSLENQAKTDMLQLFQFFSVNVFETRSLAKLPFSMQRASI